MSEIRLQECEERATILLAQCARLEEEGSLPSNAPWLTAFHNVKRSAQVVLDRARSPVKIGVVGEFSSGKSLLLGSLIGYADALPVAEWPTTGNVTALNFTPVNELTSTQVGPYQIYFLDHDEFFECLQYMLDRAKSRAREANLPPELRAAVEDIRANDASIPAVEDWCKRAWVTKNPKLRYLIRELVAFLRAYKYAGMGLCGSREPFEVSVETAKAGLNLAELEDNIQSMAFNELPEPATRVSSRPVALTKEMIQAGFPLIRLVSVNVRVSKQIWNLSNFEGENRFVLLDFPGLGAESSGVRDRYLCLRELKNIQTILILLNGKKPGGDPGTTLYNLLQNDRPNENIKDMILVAVGRFDQLPLEADKNAMLREFGAGAPRAGAATEGPAEVNWGDEDEEPLPQAPSASAFDEAALFRSFPILSHCLKGAQGLPPAEKHHRIVLVSPLLHLKFLEDRNSGIQVGSADFMGKHRADAERALEQARGWDGVAARLESAPVKPKSPIISWLRNYATDGGITRLRQLIESHVQEHGLDQRKKDLARDVASLREQLAELRSKIPAPTDDAKDTRVWEDKIHAAGEELRQLSDAYRDEINQLKKDPRFRQRVGSKDIPIEELLQREIVLDVCEWPQWQYLFHYRKDGYIEEAGGAEDPFGLKDDDDPVSGVEAEGESDFPSRSDHFFKPFATSMERLEKKTREFVEQGFEQWLNALAEKSEAARRTFGVPLQKKTLNAELARLRLGPQGKNLAGVLRGAIEPARLRWILFPVPGGRAGEAAPIVGPEHMQFDADRLFPLARSKDGNGRMFAWARTLLDGPSHLRPADSHRHQSMILRIRDQFISVLRQEMSQLLSLSMDMIVKKLSETVEAVMLHRVSYVANNRFVIEAILKEEKKEPVGGEVVAGGAADDPLAVVRDTASFDV